MLDSNLKPRRVWPRFNPRKERRTNSVIITGASRGLGAALFNVFDACGDRLLALGRRFNADQRRAAGDADRIVLRYTDLSEPDTLPSAEDFERFLASGTGEAVLVHAAAVVEPIGVLGALDNRELQAAVQVNLLAPMMLSNLFVQAAPAHFERLRIVYVTSSAAHRPYPGWATYCATKAAGELFMQCAETSADPRCTVQIVDPGAMDTDMHRTLRERGTGLPGHERLLGRELPDPRTVAKRVVGELFVG